MTKTCICDGCGWNGLENETLEIDLNEWAGYSDYNQITALPVGECPECNAPVYTLNACNAWDLAKAAPQLADMLERLALTYARYRKEQEPDWNPETNSRSLKEVKTLLQSLKG